MPTIRCARPGDQASWFALDRHLPQERLAEKIVLRQALVIEEDHRVAGILRWNLFWDLIPFCTLLYIAEGRRGRGLGRALMTFWEAEMRAQGHPLALTSTQADEDAQHFYRKLGYRDCGGLILNTEGLPQPTELILRKELHHDHSQTAP